VERIMSRLKRFFAQEDGIALATVVMMVSVLTLLSVVLIDQVTAESNRAAKAVRADSAYQAAEAGMNDYLAKLTEDPQYYDHYVAKGESTRRRSDNYLLVSHSTDATPSAWKAGVNWTYPNRKDWWYAGVGTSSGNTTSLRGTAYNLMITPPSKTLGTNYITIVSTGCKVIDQYATPLQCDSAVPNRAIEVHVRRTTPADFQYFTDYDPTKYSPVCFGSTLYGKVYSTHDICFNSTGNTYSDLMAEDNVSGITSTRLHNGARIYDRTHPNIRDVVKKQPITFASMGDPSLDIKRSSALNVPTTDFENSSVSAWRIVFSSDGTYTAWGCVNAPTPESSQPFCGSDLKLASNVSAGAKTIYVTGSTTDYPSTGKLFVGNSSGTVDTWNYTSKSSNSFSCTGWSCGIGHAQGSGENVSLLSGGITWPSPYSTGVIPSNGAIYTGQDAIISWPTAITGFTNETDADGHPTSKVNGRLSLASGGDIIIGGNIHYRSEDAGNPDDDVLGLIAAKNIWLAKYAPNNLWFRAATMAIGGMWTDYNCTNNGPDRGTSGSMTFVGTSAYSNPSGCMQSQDSDGYHGFRITTVTRIADDGSAGAADSDYAQYDALKFLFPPWYPVINGMETTVLFREVPSSYEPPVSTG
jgi:hypothetical protein